MSESGETSRWRLPLLAVGQMQKEVTHNEALALVDALLDPVVESAPQNTPPSAPLPGQCWIVGTAPVAAWTGHAGQIASWTNGGWRWLSPRMAMTVRIADGRMAAFDGAVWILPSALAAPSGGVTVDSEARSAITGLIAALQAAGWLGAPA